MDGTGVSSMAGTKTEVPRREWRAFLDGFSQTYVNRVVTIEVASAAGRLIEVEQLQLKAISIDSVEGNERIYVQVGAKSQQNVTHTIKRPIAIRLKADAQEELDIASADGTTTVVRLLSCEL
jgi:hypothetical protein